MVTVIRVTPAEAAALAAAKSPTKYNGDKNNENGGGKKRAFPSTSSGKENSKRQRTADKFAPDLEGVPPQLPIPKSNWFFDDGRMKVRASKASKYSGVHFNKASNEWMAQITIDQKLRYIGCYANEEEAAADYARAVFKYKGEEALAKERTFESTESRLLIDLNDVPRLPPIPKSAIHQLKEGGSKYAGVHLHRASNTWYAQGTIEGKRNCLIGRYVNEEEAAIDYARAVFKYQGQEALDKARAIGQDISESAINIALSDAPPKLPIDLSDVPPVPPKLKLGTHFEKGTSKYVGITFLKSSNKWKAQILIEGKNRLIGHYENEEEAAIDYARASLKYGGRCRRGKLALYKARERNKSAPAIDLSDVPPQPPILKSADEMKEGSSKYFGVSFNKANNKWMSQISIDRICRHIGCYDIEEEAAADYARAVFKYKGEEALAKLRELNKSSLSKNGSGNGDGEGKKCALPLSPEDKFSGKEAKKRQSADCGSSAAPEDSSIISDAPINHTPQHGHTKMTRTPSPPSDCKGVNRCAEAAALAAAKSWNPAHFGARRPNKSAPAEQNSSKLATNTISGKETKKKRQRADGFVIDLSDVPPQQPIPKSEGRQKVGASKYTGVSFRKGSNKWLAGITIEGKQRCIGYYENEEEAAIDYARVVFKYKGQRALDKMREQNSSRPLILLSGEETTNKRRRTDRFVLDLNGVPPQLPILRSAVPLEEGSSRYAGVSFNQVSNKWQAQIKIRGKKRSIGNYENEEEAAIDYARAAFKYHVMR